MTRGDPKSRLEASHCRHWARVAALPLSVLLLTLGPPQAFATDGQANAPNTAEQRRSEAKAKYEEGVEAYRALRYADAVRLFLEADAISPSAALSYNIARAYEKLADDAQTLRWYRNYLRLNPQAANAAEVQAYVHSLSHALAKQGLQQLTVLSSPPGATVAIDGTPLGVSPLTVELRPGSHSALLSRRGFSDFNGNFVLPPKTPIDLSIALKAAPKSVPAPSDANPEPSRRFGIVPYLTLGAAAACLSLDFAPRGERAARAAPRKRGGARDSDRHSKSGMKDTLPPYPQIEYS